MMADIGPLGRSRRVETADYLRYGSVSASKWQSEPEGHTFSYSALDPNTLTSLQLHHLFTGRQTKPPGGYIADVAIRTLYPMPAA